MRLHTQIFVKCCLSVSTQMHKHRPPYKTIHSKQTIQETLWYCRSIILNGDNFKLVVILTLLPIDHMLYVSTSIILT